MTIVWIKNSPYSNYWRMYKTNFSPQMSNPSILILAVYIALMAFMAL